MSENCMLCESIKLEDVDGITATDYFTQRKIDGNRAIMCIDFKDGFFHILNRDNKDKKDVFKEFNLESLRDSFNCDSCVVDGEIYSDRFGFDYVQERSHLSNKFSIKMLSETKPLCLNVFDILRLDGRDLTQYPIEQRMTRLSEVVVDTELVKKVSFDIGNIKEEFEKALKEGYEGLILKRIGSTYEYKRSSSWLKLKPIHTETIKVLAHNEDRKKAYGSLKTEMGDVGLLSFTNLKEFNRLVADVGLQRVYVEVEYQEITKTGKMRFPRFLRFVIE